MKNCPVCQSENSTEIFSGGDQPLARYGLCINFESAQLVEKYPVTIRKCFDCGVMYNSDFKYSLINYKSDRVQESRIFSSRIKKYMQDGAARLKILINLKGEEVVEIGCGEGYFLGLFADQSNVVGFEPSQESEIAVTNNISVIKEYYNPTKNYDIEPKLIILRQVLEHLDKPIEYLESFAKNLSKNETEGYLYIEVPSSSKTDIYNRFYDFYYEHYLYFSIKSLIILLENSGFQIISCNEELDGEIISALAVINTKSSGAPKYCHVKERLISEVNLHKAKGKKIVSWGVSGNGCALMNYCGFDNSVIEHIIDSDERKQGYFVPGTGQLVVSPNFFFEQEPDVILILSQLHKKDIIEEIKKIFTSKVQLIIPDEY